MTAGKCTSNGARGAYIDNAMIRVYASIMVKYLILHNAALRIAISSKSGCGNTTVSTIVSDSLGIPLINYTFRQMAAEKGMTLAEVMEAAKTDSNYDKYIDTHQVELARKSSCVLASRLAIWMLHEADIKVYLTADEMTRAKRIQMREGGDLETIKSFTAMRDSEDSRRYKELYGIDNNDRKNIADITIDTTNIKAEQVAQAVIDELLKKQLIAPAS